MHEHSESIVVIDDDPRRAQSLEAALLEARYKIVCSIRPSNDLSERIIALSPDMVVVNLFDPDRSTLNSMFDMTRNAKMPVAIFVNKSDDETIRQAIDAGVSAYVVDGLKGDRIRAIVAVAMSRFENIQKISLERDQARNALAERKIIDRAKGLLMEHHNVSEAEAYKLLRNNAMRQSRKIIDISESIIMALEFDAHL